MGDPLAGKREALNQGELEQLTWEDNGQGKPVEVGESFKLRSGGIEITHIRRERSKSGWWWIADFTRIHPAERDYFLDRKGGYTSDPNAAMRAQDDPEAFTITGDPMDNPLNLSSPPEPAAVPPHEIPTYTGSKQARARYEAEITEARLALDQLPLSERLRRLEIRAEQGANVDRFLGAIENRIKAGEKRVGLRRL